jgi:hypothetical protein
MLRRLRAMLPSRTVEREGVALAKGFAFADSLASSRRIAYTDEMKIVVSLPDGRERRELFRDEKGRAGGPLTWSPDGRTLYHAYDQIYAIDAVTGVARAVTEFAEEEQFGVLWFSSCSPDGRMLLFLQSIDVGPSEWAHRLCALDLAEGRVRVLLDPGRERKLWCADVSWARHLVAAVLIAPEGRRQELWALDPRTGAATRATPMPAPAGYIALSPRGKALAFADGGGVGLVSMDSGKHRWLTDFGWMPAWSPDGRAIAFLNDQCELWVLRRGRPQPQRLARFTGENPPLEEVHGSWAQPPVWSTDGRLLWFTLTQPRLRPAAEAARLQEQFRESELKDIPEDQREDARRDLREHLRWDFQHHVGAMDFVGSRVWTTHGYWDHVAWSPVED